MSIDPNDLPIREDLKGVAEYGAPMLDVAVQINTNENPSPPAEELVAEISELVAQAATTLNRYPDRDAIELRTALAEYITQQSAIPGQLIEVDNVWVANGSNEVLQQLLQVFGGAGRLALGFEPTYSMHKIISRGTQTDYLSITRDGNYGIPIEEAVSEIRSKRPAVVFVCSPNNPTGTSTPLEDIATIYDAIVETDTGVLIVDEAYVEFSHQDSAVTLLPKRPRLIVSRTMSKAFAYAGARIGYCVADPAVIEVIKRVRLPYHLSAVTQAVGIAALRHVEAQLRAVEELKVQRDRIFEAARVSGFQPVPSDANFVLIEGFEDPSSAWQTLLDQGILVRDVGLPGCLRVTAGTIEETSAFVDALAKLAPTN
ncbi:MAG: histidinol-phosphate transaminase [Candidatus Nanopelagicales bacterium]